MQRSPRRWRSFYDTHGTWEEAFGLNACDYFMAWGLSKAVGRIAEAGREHVFILDKRELLCTEDELVQGRILNGDERNYLAVGEEPSLQEILFYRR